MKITLISPENTFTLSFFEYSKKNIQLNTLKLYAFK